MRFLIISVDYTDFLRWLYSTQPGLAERPYEEQRQTRIESLYGWADFYSRNLRALGHEAWDVWANNEFMQRAWARERGLRAKDSTTLWRLAATGLRGARWLTARGPVQRVRSAVRPIRRRLHIDDAWLYDILAAQIKEYKPDVILNQAAHSLHSDFFRMIKSRTRLLVGQLACPIQEGVDLRVYDLMISSLPNYVTRFRRLGVPTELNRLAFEPAILSRLKNGYPKISASFVGSFSWVHQQRALLLEHLCSHVEISVWGRGVHQLPPTSSIRARYRDTAFGLDAYRILQSSRVTVNNHESVADSYANNMRLFEATGVGTLLLTDWKVNLHEMFEPGKEVVTYRSPEECAELIRYYLDCERERDDIARAGHQRTLREHTYYQRMQELVDIVRRRMSSA